MSKNLDKNVEICNQVKKFLFIIHNRSKKSNTPLDIKAYFYYHGIGQFTSFCRSKYSEAQRKRTQQAEKTDAAAFEKSITERLIEYES